jgi:hypothetical protein
MAIDTVIHSRPYPVSPCLRVHIKHTVGSDVDVLPGFYLGFSGGPPTAAELATFATGLFNEWVTLFAGLMNVAYFFTECIVQDISTATGAEGTHAPTSAAAGTRAGTDLPASACLNLNFAVARRYRGGKPRVYLPYGTAADVASPQQWTSTFPPLVVTAWNNMITWCVGNPPTGLTNISQVSVSWYKNVVAYQKSNGETAYRPNYQTPTAPVDQIAGVTYLPTFGSQRRRNKGGG